LKKFRFKVNFRVRIPGQTPGQDLGGGVKPVPSTQYRSEQSLTTAKKLLKVSRTKHQKTGKGVFQGLITFQIVKKRERKRERGERERKRERGERERNRREREQKRNREKEKEG
jgi:hypothetical protein